MRLRYVFLLLFGTLLGLAACNNTEPTVVSILSNSPQNSSPKKLSNQFADVSLVGSQRLVTSDNYAGTIKVHSGTATRHMKTSDNYSLTLRGVSFQ